MKYKKLGTKKCFNCGEIKKCYDTRSFYTKNTRYERQHKVH